MYKKVELLSKKEHKNLAIDKIEGYWFAKELRYAPVGLSEIAKLSCKFPVFITGGETNLFSVLLAVGDNDNFFSLNDNYGDRRFVPIFMKMYPFLMVDATEEGSEKNFRALALDVESIYVGESSKIKLFESDESETEVLKQKIKLVQTFDKDRLQADNLIAILKEYNLLDKRDITLKVDENEPKTILKDFYVVNHKRLYELDDAILLEWMKKGWIHLLENHMRSIENIDLLLAQSMSKKA